MDLASKTRPAARIVTHGTTPLSLAGSVRNAAGAEFGEERLLACVKANRALAPAALLEYLFATLAEFTVGAEPFDDRTALVLRYNGCVVSCRPRLRRSATAGRFRRKERR